MAVKKKTAASVAAQQHTAFERFGGQVLHLKDEIVSGTSQLLEAAGEKISAVTAGIKELAGSKGSVTKKAPSKAKKLVKKAVKTAKKPVVKAAKKVAKKTAVGKIKKAVVTSKKKAVPKKAAAKKKAAPKKNLRRKR